MARVPIASALSASDADARIEEWRQLAERHVVEVARHGRLARFRLREGDDALACTVDLARREKACCPFLNLSLTLSPEAVWLEIQAPDEAAAVLDGLADLAPR